MADNKDKSLIPKPPESKLPIPPPPKRANRFNEQRSEVIAMEKGKLPPQAIDLEEAVLGAFLVEARVANKHIDLLKPEFFYKESHSVIFTAINNLYNNYIAVDLLTVSTELKRMGRLAMIGGDFYLISLTQKICSSAHIEFHIRIIIQKYTLRELIRQANITIEDSYRNDPDIFDIMDDIESNIANIYKTAIHINNGARVTNAKEELEEKMNLVEKGETPGVYTGISEFDDWCGGFQKRELITIAAATGMGKTTALLSIAAKASFFKKIPFAYFSLEMNETDLKNRLAAMGTKVPYEKIRQGKINAVEKKLIYDYYDYIDDSCLQIIDNTRVLEVIIKKIRELVTKHGVKAVVIDYVQLIRLANKTSNPTNDLCDVTRELKALANELNIPIIIVAMLSRKIGDRGNKRPMLSDLKTSASIEEDSDMVIFLLRMAYYLQESGQTVASHEVGKTEMIVAKGRSTGTRDFWTFLDFLNYDFRSLN